MHSLIPDPELTDALNDVVRAVIELDQAMARDALGDGGEAQYREVQRVRLKTALSAISYAIKLLKIDWPTLAGELLNVQQKINSLYGNQEE